MSEEDSTINRRSVLSGLTGGATVAATSGVASASEKPQATEPLSTHQRARLRRPYEDIEVASSILVENAEPLLDELASRDILSSTAPEDLQLDTLVSSSPRSESLDEVYVSAVYDEATDSGEVRITTTVYQGGDHEVKLGTDPETGNATALVFEANESLVTALTVRDGELTEETFDLESVDICLDEKCNDCCGWLDCDAKRRYEYEIYSGCGCLRGIGVAIPGQCCNASCDGGLPCAC